MHTLGSVTYFPAIMIAKRVNITCHDKAMEQIDVLATQSIILTIQKGLKHNGFTIKKADGFMNKQTRDALFDYAKNKKMKIPETLDGDFMRHLAESLK